MQITFHKVTLSISKIRTPTSIKRKTYFESAAQYLYVIVPPTTIVSLPSQNVSPLLAIERNNDTPSSVRLIAKAPAF